MKDATFFNKAKQAAQQFSTYPRYHIGCVCVYKKHIISIGANSTKTHPIQKIYNKERYNSDDTPHSLHAEIAALTLIMSNQNIDWSEVEIYNYRESRSGNISMSRPCKACMALIKELGIRRIHYTTTDGYAVENIQ